MLYSRSVSLSVPTRATRIGKAERIFLHIDIGILKEKWRYATSSVVVTIWQNKPTLYMRPSVHLHRTLLRNFGGKEI